MKPDDLALAGTFGLYVVACGCCAYLMSSRFLDKKSRSDMLGLLVVMVIASLGSGILIGLDRGACK